MTDKAAKLGTELKCFMVQASGVLSQYHKTSFHHKNENKCVTEKRKFEKIAFVL
jgi:hypothetical protein